MTDISEQTVALTDRAASRVRQLQQKKGNPDLMLRVRVDGGGCSGFQYRIDFDDHSNTDDKKFLHSGIAVVVDDVSLEYLAGAEIDYVESMIGAAFQVRNPNATASCGCGSSFSV